jgi:hypothetical protein
MRGGTAVEPGVCCTTLLRRPRELRPVFYCECGALVECAMARKSASSMGRAEVCAGDGCASRECLYTAATGGPRSAFREERIGIP